jgi:hypothetical protein
MKKYLRYIPMLLVAFALFYSTDASAQRYKKRTTTDDNSTTSDNVISQDSTAWQKLRRRLVFGGGAGAAFSTGGSFIEISPLVGYRITDKWQAGVGGTYIRAWGTRVFVDYQGNIVHTEKYATSIYGARTYTEYDIFKQFFLHGEYEALNLEYYDINTGETPRTWIGNPLVGGGFRSSIGEHGSFNILALYNLNYANNKERSPYPSPFVIRMNFSL